MWCIRTSFAAYAVSCTLNNLEMETTFFIVKISFSVGFLIVKVECPKQSYIDEDQSDPG